MGIFGNLFDFNRDGKLDTFEQAAEFSALMNVIENAEKDAREDDDDIDTPADFDDFDY